MLRLMPPATPGMPKIKPGTYFIISMETYDHIRKRDKKKQFIKIKYEGCVVYITNYMPTTFINKDYGHLVLNGKHAGKYKLHVC